MYGSVKKAVNLVLPAGAYQRAYTKHWNMIRPITVAYCPLMLPWFAARRDPSPTAELHRMAVQFHVRGRRPLRLTVLQWIAVLLWPFRLASNAIGEVWRHGRKIRQQYGVSCIRQLVGLTTLSLRYNCVPASYYRFRLFKPANARRALAWLHGDELDGLYGDLTWRLPPANVLSDKAAFFEEGCRLGLPVAKALALLGDGVVQRWYTPPEELPHCDLILKPTSELCGRGVERWYYDADRKTWRRGGQAYDREAFIAYCCERAKTKRYLLQERLLNHDDLVLLAPKGLATMRVVTYRRPGGAY